MNQVAIVFGLIVTAIVGIGAYTALAPLVTQSENRNMEAEIINVVNAASEFRWVNRNNAATLGAANFQALATNGYLDSELYSTGTGESVIATNIAAAPGAATPTVTYDAGDAESCNWLLDRVRAGRWPNVDAASASNACATATLTVAVE